MAAAGYNFQRCLFLSEFRNSQIFLLPKHPFIRVKFPITITSIYTAFSFFFFFEKWANFLKMSDPRWLMFPVPSFIIMSS